MSYLIGLWIRTEDQNKKLVNVTEVYWALACQKDLPKEKMKAARRRWIKNPDWVNVPIEDVRKAPCDGVYMISKHGNFSFMERKNIISGTNNMVKFYKNWERYRTKKLHFNE